MQEVSSDLMVQVDPAWNITDLVVRLATERPHRVTYTRKIDGGWRDVTARQFRDEVVAVAKGLAASRVEPGDRVAIMSGTRYEWTLLDAAIWFAGAVTVPVYETSSVDQVAWILADSGTTAVAAELPGHAETVRAAGFEGPLWLFAQDGVSELVEAGRDVSDEEIERRRRLAGLADLATIIYTSGTTGRPKGCELTHGNFVVLTENTTAALHEVVGAQDATTLLFLPLAHVFARFIEVLCMSCGAKMGHCGDVNALVEEFGAVQPTFLLSVPRVFEKIYNGAEQKALAGGRGALFARAVATAIAYSKASDAGGPGLALRARHKIFDRLVYPKLRGIFGGKAKFAVSGGAPLAEHLGHFYRGIGLTVLEGYGLTETTAPTTVNRPDASRIGTVGTVLPGITVRIAEDGEVLIKGPHVFRGYHHNETATSDSVLDGWFQTGDLGALDADGYLRITGRKKEMLVTAGGKNVAPTLLEDRLRVHPLISQCIVVGDGKPYIAALLTLDADMLPAWAAAEGLGELTVQQAARHERVQAVLQAAVDDANSAVSRAESIRRFEVLTSDFTIESGHLTPSLKLKRNVVMADFTAEVERLFT